MNSKTIIGLVLIGIILVFSMWYSAPSENTQQQENIVDNTAVSQSPNESFGSSADTSIALEMLSPFHDSTSDSLEIKTIYVQTNDMEIILTTGGADVQSLLLTNHKYKDGKNIQMVPEFLEDANYSSPNFDIDFISGDKVVTASSAVFTADKDTLILDDADTVGVITFSGILSDGSHIQRRYEFYNDGYAFHHSFIVDPADDAGFDESILWWRKGLYPTEQNVKADLMQFRFNYMMFGDIEREKFKKKKGILESPNGATKFVTTHSKYFITMLAPREGLADGSRAKGVFRQETIGEDIYDIPQIGIGLFNRHTDKIIKKDFFVYLGPADYKIISQYAENYQKAVDLGWAWLQPITKILLTLFSFMFKYIKNYGFVILLFTLLMKLLLTPLMAKQLKSQRDMQKLQPKLKNLQEKYRDNPEKLNKETMELYRKHGVNPLGGCLPMLVQMPVFFALYRALSLGFQFRGANFIFWIKDLSSPDPYMILPIVMAVTMFIQQKMTVTDPKQKMMVYIFPVFFLFLFRNMPAGLVLYWTFYNILTVVHTAILNRNKEELETVKS